MSFLKQQIYLIKEIKQKRFAIFSQYAVTFSPPLTAAKSAMLIDFIAKVARTFV